MRSKNKTHVSTCATILQVCLIREKSGNMFVKWVERLSEIYNLKLVFYKEQPHSYVT